MEILTLIRRINSGDDNAFRQLLSLYGKQIYRKILEKTGHHEVAQETVKNTFKRLYKQFKATAKPDILAIIINSIAESELQKQLQVHHAIQFVWREITKELDLQDIDGEDDERAFQFDAMPYVPSQTPLDSNMATTDRGEEFFLSESDDNWLEIDTIQRNPERAVMRPNISAAGREHILPQPPMGQRGLETGRVPLASERAAMIASAEERVLPQPSAEQGRTEPGPMPHVSEREAVVPDAAASAAMDRLFAENQAAPPHAAASAEGQVLPQPSAEQGRAESDPMPHVPQGEAASLYYAAASAAMDRLSAQNQTAFPHAAASAAMDRRLSAENQTAPPHAAVSAEGQVLPQPSAEQGRAEPGPMPHVPQGEAASLYYAAVSAAMDRLSAQNQAAPPHAAVSAAMDRRLSAENQAVPPHVAASAEGQVLPPSHVRRRTNETEPMPLPPERGTIGPSVTVIGKEVVLPRPPQTASQGKAPKSREELRHEIKRQFAPDAQHHILDAEEGAVPEERKWPLKKGRILIAGLLYILIAAALWAIAGLLMDMGILPKLDLGYSWFNDHVFKLFWIKNGGVL